MKKNLTTIYAIMLFAFLLFSACQKEKTTQEPKYASKSAHKDITEKKANIKNVLERTVTEGQTAHAIWEKTEGDIYTFVGVFFTVNETKVKGDKTIQPELIVSIFRANIVTGDLLMEASGFTTDLQFTTHNKLEAAQLVATVEMLDLVDESDRSFMLTVDMHWTGYGAIMKEKTNKYSYEEDGFKYKLTTKGESRLAFATGTVFALDENFTIGNSTEAVLSNARSGSLIIEHNN